jgi:hypothetical protein
MDAVVLTFDAAPLANRSVRIHDGRIWELLTADRIGGRIDEGDRTAAVEPAHQRDLAPA